MFCPKCGNQVSENEKFCGKCGENLQAAPQPEMQQEAAYTAQQPQQQAYQQYQQPQYQQAPQYQQQPPQYQYQPYQQAPVRPAVDPKAAGSLKIMYLITAVTSLLTAIMWFVKGIYVEAMGFKETGSFHEMCADGGEVLSVFTVVFGILIAILMIWPILSNSVAKRRLLIGTKIFAILQFLMYILIIILVADQANTYFGSMGSWGLTGIGWLHVLCLLAILVVPYIISAKSRVFPKKK